MTVQRNEALSLLFPKQRTLSPELPDTLTFDMLEQVRLTNQVANNAP
jgi:hypothetical protein